MVRPSFDELVGRTLVLVVGVERLVAVEGEELARLVPFALEQPVEHPPHALAVSVEVGISNMNWGRHVSRVSRESGTATLMHRNRPSGPPILNFHPGL
jgi:hypothetical protein